MVSAVDSGSSRFAPILVASCYGNRDKLWQLWPWACEEVIFLTSEKHVINTLSVFPRLTTLLNYATQFSPCADPEKLLSNPCVLIFVMLSGLVPWNNCRSLFLAPSSLSIFCFRSW